MQAETSHPSVVAPPASLLPPPPVGAVHNEMLELLEKVQSYVTTALADPSLASEVLLRQISDAVGCIRKVDSEEFKKMIDGGLQDLLMVMYLGQVTKTQLAMAEKITATLTV